MTQGKNWHRAEVIAAIRKRDMSLSELSRRHGFTYGVLHTALRTPYPRYNLIIADFLGLKRHEIWPEWFDESGYCHLYSRLSKSQVLESSQVA